MKKEEKKKEEDKRVDVNNDAEMVAISKITFFHTMLLQT